MNTPTLWLLTTEYNDYDQYGEYFVELYSEFPTYDQLKEAGVDSKSLERVKTLGGGRSDKMEDQWWHLKRYQPK